MKRLDIPCNPANYGGIRQMPVRYIVVHYTAGINDTAENNGRYFARQAVGASAHWFVDETTAVRSVPEDRVAWHCGGATYRHPDCRNGNAIGVEICTQWADGAYRFAPEAVENARILIRALMEQYHVPAERVLRHFDVTGKLCPAPFVGGGQAAWETFKGGLTVYQNLESVPDWSRPTIQKLVDRGVLQGDGTELNLSGDLVRTLVILDRLGVLEQQG